MRKILLDTTQIKKEDLIIDAPISVKLKTEQDKMFDYLESILDGHSYGLGLHSTKEDEKKMKNILTSGLNIAENQTVLSTVSSFGTRETLDKDYLKKDIVNYVWKNGESIANIVVLVPSIVTNSKKEKIYLGFPPYDTSCANNNYRTTCVLDDFCRGNEEKGSVPPEFIAGYFVKEGDLFKFEKNPKYYKYLSQVEKDILFDKISNKISDESRTISNAVISKDVDALNLLREMEHSKTKIEIAKKIKYNVLNKGVNQQTAESMANSEVQLHQNDTASNALMFLERKLEQLKNTNLEL